MACLDITYSAFISVVGCYVRAPFLGSTLACLGEGYRSPYADVLSRALQGSLTLVVRSLQGEGWGHSIPSEHQACRCEDALRPY